MGAQGISRAVGPLVLAVAIAVAAWVLLGGGDGSVKLHARFENAGQLVKGAEVRIAGRRVGKIGDITLADNGQADVAFTVTDGAVLPLHEGTHATIRLPGQASVAGRIIELTPGPDAAPRLQDGAVLGTSDTTGIVDIDAVLNALDPATRRDVRGIVAEAASVFAGSGARSFNGMLAEFNPAVAQLRGVATELGDSRRSLQRVLRASATVTHALAVRRDDLVGAVASTGQVVSTLASQRRALAETLDAAPPALARVRGTLQDLRRTVSRLRPTLRLAVPATVALRGLLRVGGPALRRTAPVLDQAASLAPATTRALRAVAKTAPGLTAALSAAAPVVKRAMPILRGLRYYGADFVLGLFSGLAGNATANYDANGHYGRIEFVVSPQSAAAGSGSSFFSKVDLGLLKPRTGLTARCPGATVPPAPDGSNPWVPDPTLCDPSESVSASVDQP